MEEPQTHRVLGRSLRAAGTRPRHATHNLKIADEAWRRASGATDLDSVEPVAADRLPRRDGGGRHFVHPGRRSVNRDTLDFPVSRLFYCLPP